MALYARFVRGMGCVGVVDVLWFALFDVLVDAFLEAYSGVFK